MFGGKHGYVISVNCTSLAPEPRAEGLWFFNAKEVRPREIERTREKLLDTSDGVYFVWNLHVS